MIYIRTGSQLYKLITLLSLVGEYPISSVHLLGNERVYKALIHNLTKPQKVRIGTVELGLPRLFTISGKGKEKTLRFYKGALKVLNILGLREHYDAVSRNHRFAGDSVHRGRNHRIAEAAAMCMQAGIECRPYCLPVLQNGERLKRIRAEPSFYFSKALKQVGEIEANKTMFTRLVGAMFSYGECFAVYNARGSAMKWNGMGEFKALYSLAEVTRLNASNIKVDSAILFGTAASAAATLAEAKRERRREFRFDAVYRHIHFVPLDDTGIQQLRLLTVPYFRECIENVLFEPDERSHGQGRFEYDACIGGVYVLSFLDGDLARLMRFSQAASGFAVRCEVVCFPDQREFVREVCGSAKVKTIEREVVEYEMKIERRDIFEE